MSTATHVMSFPSDIMSTIFNSEGESFCSPFFTLLLDNLLASDPRDKIAQENDDMTCLQSPNGIFLERGLCNTNLQYIVIYLSLICICVVILGDKSSFQRFDQFISIVLPPKHLNQNCGETHSKGTLDDQHVQVDMKMDAFFFNNPGVSTWGR